MMDPHPTADKMARTRRSEGGGSVSSPGHAAEKQSAAIAVSVETLGARAERIAFPLITPPPPDRGHTHVNYAAYGGNLAVIRDTLEFRLICWLKL